MCSGKKDYALFDLLRSFSSVTKERTEVIFQGTRNLTIIPDHEGGIWEEYQFQCKPGDPKRRPCVISPYHYRLDWLMWFAAFQVSMLLIRLLGHVLWSSRLKFVSPEDMSLRVITKNFGRRKFGFLRHISSGEMTFGRLDWLPWRKGGLARGKNTRLVLLSDSSVPDVSSLFIVAQRMVSHPSVRVR